MLTPQFILDLRHKQIGDLFAGGGGASCAIEQATGLYVDFAVNHDAQAVSMHTVNHPQTRHYQTDVYEVDPYEACGGRPVGLLHLSPDCTHHSQAAGGQPRDNATRSLSWVGKRWAAQVRPDIITLENVKQITRWGRLVAKRDKVTGRVVKLDGSIAAPGERVPVQNQFLVPDTKYAGSRWRVVGAPLITAHRPHANGCLWWHVATAGRLYGRRRHTIKTLKKAKRNGGRPQSALIGRFPANPSSTVKNRWPKPPCAGLQKASQSSY